MSKQKISKLYYTLKIAYHVFIYVHIRYQGKGSFTFGIYTNDFFYVLVAFEIQAILAYPSLMIFVWASEIYMFAMDV